MLYRTNRVEIAKAMLSKNKTTAEIVKELGISRMTFHKYLRGNYPTNLDTAQKLRQYFGEKAIDIIEG